MPAPRRPLNPLLRRRVERSGQKLTSLAAHGGWTQYPSLYSILREEKVRATALTIARLERVADAVGFPKDEIFLDGVSR